MPDFTQFKSVVSIGDSLISDTLESNIVSFFDWAFLGAGGFFNVTFPSQGTALRQVSDPDYEAGQVWEGFRKNWVWESGVPWTAQPIGISGVWNNGHFVPVGSGYHIDYPNGRVVFDEPASGTVAVEFSFRRVSMDTADSEWFQQLQFNTLGPADLQSQAQFQEVGSGAWNVLAQNRIQLPALVVEAVNRVRMIPFELGSKSRVHQQDVLFHVLAETPFDMRQLHDIVLAQYDHRIFLFDPNLIDQADAWPLDYRGTPRPGALQYPDLVAPTGEGGYQLRVCAILNVRSEPQTSYPPLYRATCRATFEIDLP